MKAACGIGSHSFISFLSQIHRLFLAQTTNTTQAAHAEIGETLSIIEA